MQSKAARIRKNYCEPYNEKILPYIFVSYAHTDKAKVKPVVDALYRQGFRIWYDEGGTGIFAGASWKNRILDRLRHSSAFLGFVSQHNENRPIVLEEMREAVTRQKRQAEEGATDYPVVFVCLEKVSTRSFPEECRDHLNSYQFIDYKALGGLTQRLMDALAAAQWPNGVVDEGRIGCDATALEGQSRPSKSQSVLGSLVLENDDFANLARFEREKDTYDNGEDKAVDFFKSSPDQIDRNAAYITFLDNQWLPEALYDSQDFREGGLLDSAVQDETQRLQRREICRGLLSNWQIVVNRASMWNSRVFSRWYGSKAPGEDRRAFAQLIEDGGIILYLMKEATPVQKADFDVDQQAAPEWRDFCEKHPITCLRFDWDVEKSNEFECAELVSRPFQDFCLTTASNPDRIASFGSALGLRTAAEAEGFSRRWQAVQSDAIAWVERQRGRLDGAWKDYNRERFYQEFVIKDRHEDGTRVSVQEGILDWDVKPYASELKHVIDFVYAMTLPMALQIRPLLPPDSRLQPYLISDTVATQRRREIDKDELVYAIGEFNPNFESTSLTLADPKSSNLSLAMVGSLRALPSWRNYMIALSECRERSRLDQVDLYDALRVWDQHSRFVSDAKSGALASFGWEPRESALSVMFQFEEYRISIIYTNEGRRLSRYDEGWKDLPSLKRKTNLTISFVCCNVEKDAWADNVLLSENLLFDGVTHVNGAEIVSAIVDMFPKRGI